MTCLKTHEQTKESYSIPGIKHDIWVFILLKWYILYKIIDFVRYNIAYQWPQSELKLSLHTISNVMSRPQFIDRAFYDEVWVRAWVDRLKVTVTIINGCIISIFIRFYDDMAF